MSKRALEPRDPAGAVGLRDGPADESVVDGEVGLVRRPTVDSADGDDVAAVLADLRSVRRIARTVALRLGDEIAAPAEAVCKRLSHRLDLGVDHTIVAILGGTGCGKSSLFNALAGMEFADVGALRPTTARPAACVWGEGAGRLLQWLGLTRDMWIQRDSMLEEHIKELRGLILLDLPDIDSIASGHRETVDQLIPLADMLGWVTDPVKYADPSLHSRYLEPMREHEGSMVVVLNQVDTLTAEDAAAVRLDLAARLADDALGEVVVLPTSAVTGAGVEELRGLLAQSTRARTTPTRRARAELREAARGMIKAIGDPAGHLGAPPAWIAEARAEAVESLHHLCGAAAAVDALRAGQEPSSLVVPDIDQVRMALLTWLQRALAAVPPPWGPAIGHTLASSQNISVRLGELLNGLAPGPRPGFFARLLRRGKAHRERAESYDRAVRAALDALIALTMVAPSLAVLEDWSNAWSGLAAVVEGWDAPARRPRGEGGGTAELAVVAPSGAGLPAGSVAV